MLVWLSALLAIALAVVGTWMALLRGRSTLGRPRPWLRATAVLLPSTFLLLAAISNVVWSLSPPAGAMFDANRHLPCFASSLWLASLPFGAMMFLERHSDPVDPSATGAMLGACAGTWALVALTLECPQSDIAHLGLSHVLPHVIFIVAGACLGALVLGLRRRP